MDEQEFKRRIDSIFREHSRAIILLGAKQRLPEADRDELVSRTFIAFIQHARRKGLGELQNLGGYLYRIAQNELKRMQREQARYVAPPEDSNEDHDPPDGDSFFDRLLHRMGIGQDGADADIEREEEQAQREEESARLGECWERFWGKHPRHARILERTAEGTSYQELAEDPELNLKCTPERVRTYFIYEARKKARAFLERCLKNETPNR